MKYQLQEIPIRRARQRAVDFIDAPRGPGMHGWIRVAERPLVGRQLAIRMLIAVLHQQQQLTLGKRGIDQRERGRMKRQVP